MKTPPGPLKAWTYLWTNVQRWFDLDDLDKADAAAGGCQLKWNDNGVSVYCVNLMAINSYSSQLQFCTNAEQSKLFLLQTKYLYKKEKKTQFCQFWAEYPTAPLVDKH